MKKRLFLFALFALLCLILLLSSVACNDDTALPSEASTEENSSEQATESFSEESNDFTSTETTAPIIFDFTETQGEASYTIDAFPNITFIKSSGAVTAYDSTTDTSERLYYGMPVWNIYFYDVTLDGIPDICSTVSIGSGWIDERIMIYDYQNKTLYTIEDRFNTNYTLQSENGVLYLYATPSTEFNYTKRCPLEEADYREVTEQNDIIN